MSDFETIQRLLRKSRGSATADKYIFERWKKGEISTAMCFDQFCKQNGIVFKKEEIDLGLFEKWLISLGYIRK